MMSASNKLAGFTLIELMIVMTITGLLMGLVGPMTIHQLERSQAKSELLNLKRQLKNASIKAFFSGKALRYDFDGKTLIISELDKAATLESKVVEFNYLFFERQKILFNSKGFVDTLQLKANYNDKPLNLEIAAIINRPYLVNSLKVDESFGR